MRLGRWLGVGFGIFLLLSGSAPAWDTLPSRADDEPGFQYTSSPADWRTISMYQIMTDRFNDGDPSNNTANGHYDPTYPSAIHGGDFAGIRQKLDYIQELGKTAIWISPVQFTVNAYHGYAPTDFNRIEPRFGGLQELRELIDDCHSRGIYVILDIVINHMADLIGSDDPGFPEFNWNGYNLKWWDPNRRHAPPFDDLSRFHNFGEISDYDDPWQVIYGEFNPGGLDDIRTEDPQVRQDMIRIFKALIDATDADGFRVDAVKHVEEGFYSEFMPAIYAHAAHLGKDNFLVFGEAIDGNDVTLSRWTHPEYHFNSMLNFPMHYKMLDVFVHGQRTSLLTERIDNLWRYSEESRLQLVNFLDNHDSWRIMYDQNLDGDIWRLRPALTFLYTSLHIPCLYYGTEQAFNGGTDPWNRENMFDGGFQWGPSEGNRFDTTHPLFQFIRTLNQLREAYPALTVGDFVQRWQTSSGPGIYAYSKILEEQEVLVVLNTSADTQHSTPAVSRPNGTVFVNLLDPSEQVTVTGGTLPVSVLGHDQKIFAEPRPPLWLGNVSTWPGPTHDDCPGDFCNPTLEPGEDLWVDAETRPIRPGQSATVHYRTAPGEPWTAQEMLWRENSAEGSLWHVNLGGFAAGVTIEYYVRATDGDEVQYANQGGANYSISVVSEPVPSSLSVAPWPSVDCEPVTLLYAPNNGPLEGAAAIYAHLGRNGWTDIVTPAPALEYVPALDAWRLVVTPSPGTVQLDVVFHDGAGVWDNNNFDNWFVPVEDCHEEPGLFLVTSPAASPHLVDAALASIDIEGAAVGLAGQLVWSNALTGASGLLPLIADWRIDGVSLDVGHNPITLWAHHGVGASVTQAVDRAAHYAGDGWVDGSGLGSGWGGAWFLQAFGTAGHFLADADVHSNLRLGDHAWGLWSQADALAEAIRPFAEPLGVGHRFEARLQNNWILEGAQGVGLALRDGAGDSRIQFYFNGGDEQYSVADRDGARPSGVSWSDDPLSISIEVLSHEAYRLWVNEIEIDGFYEGELQELRLWSFNGGETPEYDFYFDDLRIVAPTFGETERIDLVVVRPQVGDGDSNQDGISDAWYVRYGFDPFGPSIAHLDSDGDGASNLEEFLADTNPNDPTSVFPNKAQASVQGDTVTFTIGPPTSPDREYEILYCSDLVEGVWTPMNLRRRGRSDRGALLMTVTNASPLGAYRTQVGLPTEP